MQREEDTNTYMKYSYANTVQDDTIVRT